MNTKPVDVRAVLSEAVEALHKSLKHDLVDDVCAAYAAIAELVAADEEYDAAESEYDNESCWDCFKSKQRLDRASKRRAAALARVKGEA